MPTKKLHTGLLFIFITMLMLLHGPVMMSISGNWLDIPVVWWFILAVSLGMALALIWIFAITKNDEDA